MNRVALTPEEQQFAADNHNLIYKFLNSHDLCDDDFYDIAVFGFLKSVRDYLSRPSLRRLSFSTVAWKGMRQSISNHEKAQKRQKRSANVISLDSELRKGQGRTMQETLSMEDYLMQELEVDLMMHELAQRVTDQELDVVRLTMEGYDAREIARRHEMTTDDVSQMLGGLRNVVLSVCYG